MRIIVRPGDLSDQGRSTHLRWDEGHGVAGAALVFAGYGARLTLADVDIDGGHETEKMVMDLGAEVFFAATNVADEGDVATLIGPTVRFSPELRTAGDLVAAQPAGQTSHGATKHAA